MTVSSNANAAPFVVGPDSADAEAPAVVAVVVAREAGERFELALQSLAVQDYPNLSVLVIDTAESPVADRVASILPDAFIRRTPGITGFSVAANQAIELVSGGSFFMFCTDEVVLEAACVTHLVEEVYRSNAGIVTPKYVQAVDPRKLSAIGLGSDRFGVPVDLVEPGEFDQEQYDAVQDVFVAPVGVQLIRSDLFRALGGFDPALGSVNEDLDLCWRAHVAGARVVAVPDAAVQRTHIDPAERSAADIRAMGRHRLRSLLVTSSRFSLIRVVPVALLLLMVETTYSLISGQRRQVGDAFSAVSWNASRTGDIRRRRREVQALRKVSDREVHALQVGGSARLNSFVRGQFTVGDRLVLLAGTVRDSFSGQQARGARDASIIGGLLGFMLLLGSRGLIGQGVVPYGQFLDLPDTGALFDEWFGGWRRAEAGRPANPASAFLVLALLRVGLFFGDGLAGLALTVVPLVAGVVGAWLLARPLGSSRASALAALAYAANPLLVAIVAAGRWDSLVVWGACPYLVGSVLRLQGCAPYGRVGGQPGTGVALRDPATRMLRLGLLVAAVTTFVPAIIGLAVLIIAAVVLGTVLSLRPVGIARLGFGAVAVVVVPASLHAPWTFDVLRNFEWTWLIGPPSPHAMFDSLADLVRFAPGVQGPQLLSLSILLAAALPLLLGHGPRFEAGTKAWTLAAVFWFAGWTARRGWLPFELPAIELLLVPAAVGLALAVGAGARSAEVDLVGYRFGWRQAAAVCGVVAMAGSGLLMFRTSLDGRWQMPDQSYNRSTTLLAKQYEGPTRILWIGAPSVLAIDARTSEGGSSFAITDGGSPDAFGRWAPGPGPFDAEIGARIDLASSNNTARLGRLLAPYGVDIIVVVPQLAPAPYEGPRHDPGGGIVAALARQLDLQRVSGTPDLLVYRNNASRGPAVVIDPALLPSGGTMLDQLDTDLTAGFRADAELVGSGAWEVAATAEPAAVFIAIRPTGWSVANDSASAAPIEIGTSVGDTMTLSHTNSDGPVRISYDTPVGRWLAMLGQVVVVVVGVVLGQRRRELAR